MEFQLLFLMILCFWFLIFLSPLFWRSHYSCQYPVIFFILVEDFIACGPPNSKSPKMFFFFNQNLIEGLVCAVWFDEDYELIRVNKVYVDEIECGWMSTKYKVIRFGKSKKNLDKGVWKNIGTHHLQIMRKFYTIHKTVNMNSLFTAIFLISHCQCS